MATPLPFKQGGRGSWSRPGCWRRTARRPGRHGAADRRGRGRHRRAGRQAYPASGAAI